MKEQGKKRTLCKASDNDVKYISLHNETRFAKQGNEDASHSMDIMAVPKPTAYRLAKEDKNKPSPSDKVSDEISNILEQIGDVQAELICRHQFGNSVRPALENISEEDLCERGFRLFYKLRNKYQGKDVVFREGNK